MGNNGPISFRQVRNAIEWVLAGIMFVALLWMMSACSSPAHAVVAEDFTKCRGQLAEVLDPLVKKDYTQMVILSEEHRMAAIFYPPEHMAGAPKQYLILGKGMQRPRNVHVTAGGTCIRNKVKMRWYLYQELELLK